MARRGPKRAVMPLAASRKDLLAPGPARARTCSRKDLPDETVRGIVDGLDLPYDELPGPQSRR